MYQVIYTAKTVKSLSKIDKTQAKLIINRIEKNLINCKNPRSIGKAIKGNLKKEACELKNKNRNVKAQKLIQ